MLHWCSYSLCSVRDHINHLTINTQGLGMLDEGDHDHEDESHGADDSKEQCSKEQSCGSKEPCKMQWFRTHCGERNLHACFVLRHAVNRSSNSLKECNVKFADYHRLVPILYCASYLWYAVTVNRHHYHTVHAARMGYRMSSLHADQHMHCGK